MTRLPALMLAAALLGCTSAEAASLKPSATVTDGQILLGDLFDGLAPDQAARTIMAAPPLGRRTNLDAPTLTRIATSNGVDWQASGGIDRIVVERAAVQVGTDAIIAALNKALGDTGARGQLDVLLDNRTLSLFLPAGNIPDLRVENLAYDPQRGRLTAELIAPATGPELIRQSVSARVQDTIELPVLSHRLATGDVITDADITFIRQARDRVQAGAVTEASDLVGKALRRTIAPNQAVNARDVHEPIVVGKGQPVTILLQSAAMTLTASGKALSDGAMGELVRIVNTSSNRTIDAVVAGPNLVTVQPPGQIVSHLSGPAKNAAR